MFTISFLKEIFYPYHLPTDFNFKDQPNGSVSITILSDSNVPPKYSLGTESKATVMVQNNDALAPPTLSIESNSTEIQEGQDAYFTINNKQTNY